jgi:hypothetical protein
MAVRFPLQKNQIYHFYCGSPAVYRKSFHRSNTILAKSEKTFFKAPGTRARLKH